MNHGRLMLWQEDFEVPPKVGDEFAIAVLGRVAEIKTELIDDAGGSSTTVTLWLKLLNPLVKKDAA